MKHLTSIFGTDFRKGQLQSYIKNRHDIRKLRLPLDIHVEGWTQDRPNQDFRVMLAIALAMNPVNLNIGALSTTYHKDRGPGVWKHCKLCSKRNHFARVCRSRKKIHEVCNPHGAEYP